MLFDLSGYNATDTISKATLSLYWYYPASTTRASDTVVEVYRPVAWDPNYVSWNYRISGTLWNMAGGEWYDVTGEPQGSTPYAFVIFPASKVPDNGYYDFDVTQLVQEYINDTYENTGFFLKAKAESGNYIAFYSLEYSNTSMRPKLTITTTSGSNSTDASPVAAAGPDQNVTIGSVVIFNGSGSTDDVGIASYSWDFNAADGITSEATNVTATHVYTSAGNYTVTLTVTDKKAQTSTDTLTVFVSSPVLPDTAPVADAGADKNVTVGSVVSFNGSGSTDDVGIASYSWDFNAADGITSEATNVTATHVYTSAGNYTVTLTVTDKKAQTSTDTLTVFVSSPVLPDTAPVADAGADKNVTVGSVVSFNGSGSTDDVGITSYSWDFNAADGITSEATNVTATHVYAFAGNYTVTLTVKDNKGQTSNDSLTVFVSVPVSPDDVPVDVDSNKNVTVGSMTSSPIYDNGMRASSPNSVISTAIYLDAGKNTSICRDVMLFDLSGYNATDTISKATLSLYWYYPASTTRTSDTVVEIYRPVAWDPDYVSWSYRTS
jgi:PKD repeat protein